MEKIYFASVKDGMMFFGERTSAIVNAVLLMAVYIVGVGSMSLLSKIIGKKFLELDIDRTRESYWVKKMESPEKLQRYFRQF
jgi:hypothetical protein